MVVKLEMTLKLLNLTIVFPREVSNSQLKFFRYVIQLDQDQVSYQGNDNCHLDTTFKITNCFVVC